MAGNSKQLGARIVGATEAGEPVGTTTQNGGHHGDGFDVVHGGGAAIKSRPCRKRRLHAGHAFFALKAFQQRSFLAADVRPCAVMQVNLEIPP